MVRNGRIWDDEEPFQHLLAILGHVMPTSTRIFENGTARSRRLSRCVAGRQYKNYECQEPLFPSLPSLLFSLSCGFEAVRSHQNLGFGVVRVKTGKFSFACFQCRHRENILFRTYTHLSYFSSVYYSPEYLIITALLQAFLNRHVISFFLTVTSVGFSWKFTLINSILE